MLANGGTEPLWHGAGFAFAAKGVTRVTFGFSDFFHDQ
jgi:hypothetical protein